MEKKSSGGEPDAGIGHFLNVLGVGCCVADGRRNDQEAREHDAVLAGLKGVDSGGESWKLYADGSAKWEDARRIAGSVMKSDHQEEEMFRAKLDDTTSGNGAIQGTLEQWGICHWEDEVCTSWSPMYVELAGALLSIHDGCGAEERTRDSIYASTAAPSITRLSDDYYVERLSELRWRMRRARGDTSSRGLGFEWRAPNPWCADQWIRHLEAACAKQPRLKNSGADGWIRSLAAAGEDHPLPKKVQVRTEELIL
eukprot:gnl/TRDRNA2_/TRDRNA2_195639_c0_seq1.p1 gnl/TRDRNA2_/TRDRNA2_195639_c0~~gnl/TRDRNA2_/TRDRNA2_195639_c0_seq1.p1  ORF type:complete len:254 (-),score=46.39 gnl/TRDRNA2_/TRDRNA2_195639_c0_seq1:37-798(-)